MDKILITGCAGFIGYHLSNHFLQKGDIVFGIDNLSRNGSQINLKLLENSHSNKNQFYYKNLDITDITSLESLFIDKGPFDLVIHEAAQVAVTTSILDPFQDFEINARGTLNLLECCRKYSPNSFFEFASTNKVYGELNNHQVIETETRSEYKNLTDGISETENLDFHSPYGCSKGSADQYVKDYYRIFGLKSVVFRQSCIYGTQQFGVEDQGWIAWFIIASILNKKINVYGNGKQVRDILWIDDLIELYDISYQNASKVAGQVFNIGGGKSNTLSILELLTTLSDYNILSEQPVFQDWRPGDQKIYVSDISKIKSTINWEPKISPEIGIKKLIDWVKDNKELISLLHK